MPQSLISIEVDEASWKQLEQYMRDGLAGVPNALRLAVNRTMDHGFTETHRTIRRLLNVKQADLTKPHRFGNNKPYLTKKPAGKQGREFTAEVLIQGDRRIPIWRLGGKATLGSKTVTTDVVRYQSNGRWVTRRDVRRRQPITHRQPQWKIKYTIRPGQRKTIDDGPFKATFKSGHTGIFLRKPGATRAIGTELKGPSVWQVASDSPEIAKLFRQDLSAELAKNIDQQIERLLRRAGRGGSAA